MRGDELVDYAFMGTDAAAAEQSLRDARDSLIPILSFLGVAPQRYTFVWPTYVPEWSAAKLKVRLAFGVRAAAGYAVATCTASVHPKIHVATEQL